MHCGGRHQNDYQLRAEIIPQLVEPLVDAGAVIVSGMAFGVDAAAHEVAVKKGRRTIAVLGGGLDEKSLVPKTSRSAGPANFGQRRRV